MPELVPQRDYCFNLLLWCHGFDFGKGIKVTLRLNSIKTGMLPKSRRAKFISKPKYRVRDFKDTNEEADSDKLRHDQKCKKMKLSQDMQLIQKLRDDQKRMKKVFEVMSGRNIVTNSRVTPSWREIVSLTFSEAGVLQVN
ncbi:hypothetical protein Tco_0400468 [Tanacetum coccineum]